MNISDNNNEVIQDILKGDKYLVIPKKLTEYQLATLRFIEDFPLELSEKVMAVIETGAIDVGNVSKYVEPEEEHCEEDCEKCSCDKA